MITLQPSDHMVNEGIETFAYPSAVTPDQRHFVSSTDNGPWMIAPGEVAHTRDLTISEAKTFAAELRHLIDEAERLERVRTSAAGHAS